jgi:hypothetical protein
MPWKDIKAPPFEFVPDAESNIHLLVQACQSVTGGGLEGRPSERA